MRKTWKSETGARRYGGTEGKRPSDQAAETSAGHAADPEAGPDEVGV